MVGHFWAICTDFVFDIYMQFWFKKKKKNFKYFYYGDALTLTIILHKNYNEFQIFFTAEENVFVAYLEIF